jgi:hypothetical protein
VFSNVVFALKQEPDGRVVPTAGARQVAVQAVAIWQLQAPFQCRFQVEVKFRATIGPVENDPKTILARFAVSLRFIAIGYSGTS